MTDPVPSKATCTDCLSVESRDGKIVHKAGCSHVEIVRDHLPSKERDIADELEELHDAHDTLERENDRLRTALRGIQSCSTCEACRRAATLALGGATPEPAADQVAAIETIAQAFLEVQHAQSVGANWYTRGASGLYQQVAMWVRKGQEAVKTLRAAQPPEKSLATKLGEVLIGRGFYDRLNDLTIDDTPARILAEFLKDAKPIVSQHFGRTQPPGDDPMRPTMFGGAPAAVVEAVADAVVRKTDADILASPAVEHCCGVRGFDETRDACPACMMARHRLNLSAW